MEQTLRLSSSFNRVSDVSQLDKINAIPNKSTDNVLMDGLCQEDQLYLSALMDDDAPAAAADDNDDDDDDAGSRPSAWSPMVQSPVIMNKRIKKLRPAYAVTLSLEDISYIRPSWGISKGVRTIEMGKPKRRPVESEKKTPLASAPDKTDKGSKDEQLNRNLLYALGLVVLLLTVPIYVVERSRRMAKISSNKIQVNPNDKTLRLFRPTSDALDPMLSLQFGLGIPRDLKFDECTCDIFTKETGRYHPGASRPGDPSSCFYCLDWAIRANLRVYVERIADDSLCYHIKWQSYDALTTPLVDCLKIGDNEQWFGLGDLQSAVWPLNGLSSNWTNLVTNLPSEFPAGTKSPVQEHGQESLFGSHANLSVYSTRGIHLTSIKTDFDLSIRLMPDEELEGGKKLCLSVSCTERCSSSWTRADHLDEFRYQNNILEYRVCTSNSMRSLISRQIDDRTRLLARDLRDVMESPPVEAPKGERSPGDREKTTPEWSGSPDGIGLIERTIFATSKEFLPVLDGQTLRQYVDTIVKLGLKSSLILSIDTRWETYVGSLKLNLANFPKAKLLFEILHNKGFKIILTVKPYIDTGIGVGNINQLFALGRLYTTSYRIGVHSQLEPTDTKAAAMSSDIIRRRSLFTYQNETIDVGLNGATKVPYLFKCRESQEGHCALVDLSLSGNRNWLIDSIKRSTLLAHEADGIQIGGTHPSGFHWDDHYRSGVSALVKSLFYKERLYTLPQWTGDLGYIQLAPRHATWEGLRSTLNSVLNLGLMGFSLVHPGSVWGDLKLVRDPRPPNKLDTVDELAQLADAELAKRWLQVSIFLPILQFNDIEPIERYHLLDLTQNLVKIRKLYVVPELKKHLPYTPLISGSKPNRTQQMPLIGPVWFSHESGETVVAEQFMVGPDILVGPVLSEGLRQKDIYLPSGFWRDELRQTNLRGGKWLRNYPIGLEEVAWFTRSRRN